MGMANWVVGKMVDAFIAQPPAEKAAVFDTMATKFWDAATPAEITQISELLLPRFLDQFLNSASAEQKIEMMRSFISSDALREHVGTLLPSVMQAAIEGMSDEQRQSTMQAMFDPQSFAAQAAPLLPGLLADALKAMSPEQLAKMLPMPGGGMPGGGMGGMFGSRPSGSASTAQPKPKPPQSPGDMLPW